MRLAGPDRAIRVADNEIDPEHMRIVPHEYAEGVVYDRGGLVIRAIEVDHGEFIRPAYDRVEYCGRVFVHSHDTRYNENLIRQAQGPMFSSTRVAAAKPGIIAHPAVKVAIDHLRDTGRGGRVFRADAAKLAMLTHLVLLKPDPVSVNDVMAELATEYDGTVLVAEDLMTIQIRNNVSVIPYRHGGSRVAWWADTDASVFRPRCMQIATVRQAPS